MNQGLLVVAVALTVGAVVFGVITVIGGNDEGLRPAESDERAVPLPGDRPLAEDDLGRVRFDTALRGYQMSQVDAALRRAAYDIGYKDELIKVLQGEVDALREGRFSEAEVLRRTREAAVAPPEIDDAGTDDSPADDSPTDDPATDDPATDDPAVSGRR